MTSPAEERATDAELCSRIRTGEAAAVRALLGRDHAVAVLFARVADPDGDCGPLVDAVWEQLLGDIVEGTIRGGLRAALLARVAEALKPAGQVADPTPPVVLGSFVASGDRWEGWWDEPPPAWPPDAIPQPEHVLRALRRLPRELRELLVLRGVAGLSAEDVRAVTGNAVDSQATVLESAEEAYLVELDREMGST